VTADRQLVELLAEALQPVVIEAVDRAVRAALAGQASPKATPLLTVAAAAKIAGCHSATVRRRIADGSLPATRALGRHPRIRRDDLDRFLQPGGGPS